jgi:ADP-heptose:LPS heptosyltransferase
MLQMDLVITPDAMPAHLAATLGVPTWVMLRHDADWRWMDGRTDSPWYPAARLFRQRSPGDWAGVVDAIAAALTRVRANSGS